LVTSALDRTSLLELSRAWGAAATGTSHRAHAGYAADNSNVTVLSNGVDLDYFTPVDAPRASNALVFSGKMSYHANESAVLHLVGDILPLVWARRPDTRLTIVGKDPSKQVRQVVAAHANRATLTGTVADVRPHLRRAALAVAPVVYGVGCQNKVLEAMACATPVVASPRAVAALDARPGRDVVVADTPEAFADAVIALLDDPARRLAIGHAGRAYADTHHRWDHMAARLEGVYQELIAERHGRSPAREAAVTAAAAARVTA
jgi:glycosyltransferase involved in cell wall biosynthesis